MCCQTIPLFSVALLWVAGLSFLQNSSQGHVSSSEITLYIWNLAPNSVFASKHYGEIHIHWTLDCSLIEWRCWINILWRTKHSSIYSFVSTHTHSHTQNNGLKYLSFARWPGFLVSSAWLLHAVAHLSGECCKQACSLEKVIICCGVSRSQGFEDEMRV